MRRFLCFLLCLCSNYLIAQKMPDYGFNRIRITQEDKVLQFETQPVKGHPVPKPQLWYFWYSANQIQNTQGGYSGKLLNGDYRSYYLNKNLMEQGSFNAGLKDGTWKSWTANGVLRESISWQNGWMTGEFNKYDDTGKLRLSGRYKNGVMDGPIQSLGIKDTVITTWYKAGTVVEHKPFLKRIHLFPRKNKPQQIVTP
jgi:antitoxin component YwqK of YwqJK toxin-antitoxin module